jgi:hypothetical protein
MTENITDNQDSKTRTVLEDDASDYLSSSGNLEKKGKERIKKPVHESPDEKEAKRLKKWFYVFAIGTAVTVGLVVGGWRLFEKFGSELVNYAINNSLNWFAQYGNLAFVIAEVAVLAVGISLSKLKKRKLNKKLEEIQDAESTICDENDASTWIDPEYSDDISDEHLNAAEEETSEPNSQIDDGVDASGPDLQNDSDNYLRS